MPSDFSLHANPKRRLPVSLFQPLRFVRDVAQRGENKPPGKLRGGVRGGKACRRDHHAVLGAGVDVDMSRAAPGLADQPEPGQTLDERSRKWRACLGEDDGFGFFQPLGKARRILFRVVIDQNLVSIEFWIAAKRAKRVLIVIDYGDFHGYLLD